MGCKFCATRSMGFKKKSTFRRNCGTIGACLSLITNTQCCLRASPKTCPANIGKGCGDDWEGEFFPGIPKIKYESPSSKSPLAFKWYNAEEEILGKKMSVTTLAFPSSQNFNSQIHIRVFLLVVFVVVGPYILCSSQEKDILKTPIEEKEQKALYYAIVGFMEKWWNGSDLYPDPCGWTPI